jgi:hypothetical protein
MMTTTSGALRRRPRDSDDDIETRVFQRPPPFGLDRAMVVQIMRDLDPRNRARAGARPLMTSKAAIREEPNVFLTPLPGDLRAPWAQSLEETGKRVRIVRRRSLLPWFAGAMSFALAFGVLYDPVARAQTRSQLQSAATTTQSSAIRLYRLVSRIRT